MSKFLKIFLISALIVLVVFAAVAESFNLPTWIGGISTATYLRLVALLGLIVAAFVSWGYKRKVESSQKYRRAQEIVSQAELDAERRQGVLKKMQEKLQAEFDQKEQALRAEMDQIRADCNHRLQSMKEQNMQLKDAVGKLMQELKKQNRRSQDDQRADQEEQDQ